MQLRVFFVLESLLCSGELSVHQKKHCKGEVEMTEKIQVNVIWAKKEGM